MSHPRRTRETLLTGLLFVGSLSLVLLGLNRHGYFTSNRELHYGAQLEECQLVTPGDEVFQFHKGVWYFVVVATLEQDGSFLNYLEMLLASPRLQTGNLQPLALIDGSNEDTNIRQYIQTNNLSYAVIPLHDIHASALAELGIIDHRKRFFFLNPDLRVVFHSEFMKPQDLRLLMEKYFGSPSNGTAAINPLRVGDTMPSLSLMPVRPHQEGFDPRSSLLVIFTSSCVSCSLDNKLTEISLHQETLKEVASMEGLDVSLIFSPAFVAREVFYRLEETEIEMPTFIASDLAGIEDSYRREPYYNWDVLIVKVNGEGKITQLEPFEKYLDEVFNT